MDHYRGKNYMLNTKQLIVELSKAHWKEYGNFTTTNGSNIDFPGNKNGMAILIKRQLTNLVLRHHSVNSRIITFKRNTISTKLKIKSTHKEIESST